MSFLGVVAALPAEARCIAGAAARAGESVAIARDVRVALSGLGPLKAQRTAQSLIADGAGALLSWGTAAGLDPALVTGTIVLPRRVLSSDRDVFNMDTAWRDRITAAIGRSYPVHDGDVAETAAVLRDAGDKASLRRHTGAAAADMESGSVARTAVQAGISCAVVRVVLDGAGAALPRAARYGIDEWGRVRPAGLLGALLNRPADLRDLIRVAREFRIARGALCHVARAAGTALLWQGSTGLSATESSPRRHRAN